MVPRGLHLLVVILFRSLSTLHQSCSMWPLEYGRSDDIALLRMDYKRHHSFHLSVSQSLCLSLSLCLPLSPLTLVETSPHVVSHPMERPTWERIEAFCQQSLTCHQILQTQPSLQVSVAPGDSLTGTSQDTQRWRTRATQLSCLDFWP